MTTIKELVEERARAMAAHDDDNYGPIYVVGACNAIIADILNARDDLLTVAPAAGAEVAAAAPSPAEVDPAPELTPQPVAAEPDPPVVVPPSQPSKVKS